MSATQTDDVLTTLLLHFLDDAHRDWTICGACGEPHPSPFTFDGFCPRCFAYDATDQAIDRMKGRRIA